MNETVDLCQSLIKIPSYGATDGENAVIDFIQTYLGDAAISNMRVVAGRPNRPNLICEMLSKDNAGPTLILTCHVDVFGPETDRWTIDPLQPEIRDRELWGAGASDAKGGLAAMLVAARRLATNGGPRAGKLVLVFTADEDCNGKWGLPWLVENEQVFGDAAIALGPAGFNADYDGIPLTARGYINAEITVAVSERGYGWQYRPDTPHAVAVAAQLLLDIERNFRPAPASHPLLPSGPTVVAGSTFTGGEFAGVLAESARFSVEARLLPGTTADGFLTQLRAFVRERVATGTVEVEMLDVWTGGYAAGCDISTEHPLAIAAIAAARASGYSDVQFSGSPLFCESALIAELGIPTLPAIGPGRIAMAHQPDERASVQAIDRCTQILTALIDEILAPSSVLT